jgi:hypothetical protein
MPLINILLLNQHAVGGANLLVSNYYSTGMTVGENPSAKGRLPGIAAKPKIPLNH